MSWRASSVLLFEVPARRPPVLACPFLNGRCPRERMTAPVLRCFGASTRKLTMVFSLSALAASSRCRPIVNRPSNNHDWAFLLGEPPIRTLPSSNTGRYSMAKRRAWTATEVRGLKAMAKTKTPARRIAKKLKRTEGATRQKAFSIGLSLESRF